MQTKAACRQHVACLTTVAHVLLCRSHPACHHLNTASSSICCALQQLHDVPTPLLLCRLVERMLMDIQSGPLDMRNANLTDTITMRGMGRQQLVGQQGWATADSSQLIIVT